MAASHLFVGLKLKPWSIHPRLFGQVAGHGWKRQLGSTMDTPSGSPGRYMEGVWKVYGRYMDSFYICFYQIPCIVGEVLQKFLHGLSMSHMISRSQGKLHRVHRKTRWAREPKSKAAQSTPFLGNLVVWEATLCTKPRQDLYWDTAPQCTTASCVSYV